MLLILISAFILGCDHNSQTTSLINSVLVGMGKETDITRTMHGGYRTEVHPDAHQYVGNSYRFKVNINAIDLRDDATRRFYGPIILNYNGRPIVADLTSTDLDPSYGLKYSVLEKNKLFTVQAMYVKYARGLNVLAGDFPYVVLTDRRGHYYTMNAVDFEFSIQ